MTEQEQQIALCEWAGWHPVEAKSNDFDLYDGWYATDGKIVQQGGISKLVKRMFLDWPQRTSYPPPTTLKKVIYE